MRIAIGNDHRGVAAKQELTALLQRLGHTCVDLGSNSEDAVDYPDIDKKRDQNHREKKDPNPERIFESVHNHQ